MPLPLPLLNSLQQKSLAPNYLLSALQAESTNLDSIYISYNLLILTVAQLMNRGPSFNGMSPLSKCAKRSLLPFLGDALSWLTRTARTRNIRNIKKRVNQLIKTHNKQQETLAHVISILNVTRYVTQVSRLQINTVMEVAERTQNDVTTLFNIMSSIYTHINYQEILLHICSFLANLRDSLYYMRQIAMHEKGYIDKATPNILSPHVLPVEDLQEMLIHIKAELPSTMDLLVSSDDTLHFYIYLCTHNSVAEEQFLLLIDVPIQDHVQQLEIYQIFNLLIPKGNLLPWYDIDTKYLAISYDETKQWNNNSTHVNEQMDNSATLTHHLNHLPTHHHALQLPTSRIRQELNVDALYNLGIHAVPPFQHQ